MRVLKVTAVAATIATLMAVGGIQVKNKVMAANTDIMYIGEITGDPLAARTISKLQNANANEKINIHALTPGGDVIIGNEIGHAMQTSRATVTYYVGSFAASMGAMLVCQAPNVVIGDSAIIMYHMAFHQTPGDLDVSQPVDRVVKENMDNTLANCKGILTKEDITTIDSGGEVWLSGAEVNKRMEAAKPWYKRLLDKVLH